MRASLSTSDQAFSDVIVDKEACSLAMANVLASKTFSKSGRLSSFLRYVCEASLNSKPHNINEHRIGVEVFDRPEHYNPADDNIVRTSARLLRKRLIKYYEDEGVTNKVRIVIPRGGYVPVFVHFSQAELHVNTQSVNCDASALLNKDVEETEEKVLAISKNTIDDKENLFLNSAKYSLFKEIKHCLLAQNKLALGIIMISVVLLCFGFLNSMSRKTNDYDIFWQSMFNSSQPTLLVPADSELVMYQDIVKQEVTLEDYMARKFQPSASQQTMDSNQIAQFHLSHRYTSVISVEFAAKLAKISTVVNNSQLKIRYARDLHLKDLKNANVILVGDSHANPWVHLFEKNSNFTLNWDASKQKIIVRNHKPLSAERSEYELASVDKNNNGYAIVKYTDNISKNGKVLILAGTSAAATEVAMDFITDKPKFNDFLKTVTNTSKEIKNFEILLKCNVLVEGANNIKIVGIRVSPTVA